jgi:hypothetical protein
VLLRIRACYEVKPSFGKKFAVFLSLFEPKQDFATQQSETETGVKLKNET